MVSVIVKGCAFLSAVFNTRLKISGWVKVFVKTTLIFPEFMMTRFIWTPPLMLKLMFWACGKPGKICPGLTVKFGMTKKESTIKVSGILIRVSSCRLAIFFENAMCRSPVASELKSESARKFFRFRLDLAIGATTSTSQSVSLNFLQEYRRMMLSRIRYVLRKNPILTNITKYFQNNWRTLHRKTTRLYRPPSMMGFLIPKGWISTFGLNNFQINI
jgi:hypothetical protein